MSDTAQFKGLCTTDAMSRQVDELISSLDNKLISWIVEAWVPVKLKRVGFLLALLSCCGDGSGLVLWALTGRTNMKEEACSVLRGALPGMGRVHGPVSH